jgi:hypothetical protein
MLVEHKILSHGNSAYYHLRGLNLAPKKQKNSLLLLQHCSTAAFAALEAQLFGSCLLNTDKET